MKNLKTHEPKKYMKNLNRLSFLMPLAILILVVIGCDANNSRINTFVVAKDKEAKESVTSFKPGEIINARVEPSRFASKSKVKIYWTAEEDMGDFKKGETIENSENSLEITRKQIAYFNWTPPASFPTGRYKVTAELLEGGEKVDSKSVEITLEKADNSEDTSESEDNSGDKSEYSPPVGNN
jgi:hypothetical protein